MNKYILDTDPRSTERRAAIIANSVGIDYLAFESGDVRFDYEALMASTGYTLEEICELQKATKVGSTPLVELPRLTELVRASAAPGRGARILLKDEAANPSGSFKARRAAVCLHHAKARGCEGVVAATSGNYGAAVASQAAMLGLKAIILQEVYDSTGRGQPEILEKSRACEAYGAEVWQLSVGPELFSTQLQLLEETGYYNASLYLPQAIQGIESLGFEIATECRSRFGQTPRAVVVTHAGGGNVTGTARGMTAGGASDCLIVAASVDLTGLHMASDKEFNRKSFTTGHTGFGIPFAVDPDRVDVPRNAARPLRYMDRYVTVSQGEVFFATELLARLEGVERGPAGNTSLAAALALAAEFDEDDIIVVQETEYTGAGKHPTSQLTFARDSGVRVIAGPRSLDQPGQVISIPRSIEEIEIRDVSLLTTAESYVRHAKARRPVDRLAEDDLRFLALETRLTPGAIRLLWANQPARVNVEN